MSRVSQMEIKESPCKKFLQWRTLKDTVLLDGEEVEKIKGGAFTFYDKEKEENIVVPLPLKFAVLNQDLVTFKGYDEKNKRSVWSNEAKEPDHVINLRAKDEKLLTFKLSEYKVNKDTLKGLGARYTKSVYIAVKQDGKWEIWNLQLSGSALTGAVDMENPSPDEKEDGWFNFTKVNKSKLYTNIMEVSGFKPRKKGTSRFVIPVYSVGDVIEDADSQILNDLDKQLTEYLNYYFKRPETNKENKEELVEAEHDVTEY